MLILDKLLLLFPIFATIDTILKNRKICHIKIRRSLFIDMEKRKFSTYDYLRRILQKCEICWREKSQKKHLLIFYLPEFNYFWIKSIVPNICIKVMFFLKIGPQEGFQIIADVNRRNCNQIVFSIVISHLIDCSNWLDMIFGFT